MTIWPKADILLQKRMQTYTTYILNDLSFQFSFLYWFFYANKFVNKLANESWCFKYKAIFRMYIFVTQIFYYLVRSIFVCFFAVLFMETLFRMHFLKSLTLIPNFHPNIKEDFITRMTKGAPKGMLTLKASLYFILAFLILLLAYTENYDQSLWIVCIIASTAISAVSVIYLIALKRK